MKKPLVMFPILLSLVFNNGFAFGGFVSTNTSEMLCDDANCDGAPDVSSLIIENQVEGMEVNIKTDLLCGRNRAPNFSPKASRTTSPLDENPIRFGAETPVAKWKNCVIVGEDFQPQHDKLFVEIKNIKTGDQYIVTWVVKKGTHHRTINFDGKIINIDFSHAGDYRHSSSDKSDKSVGSTQTSVTLTP